MTSFRGWVSGIGYWAAVIAIAWLAFGAVAWRLDQAPDVFTDEILYTRAGMRVAEEGALTWDNGEPIFVHPPLYFLIEGAYLWLTTDPAGAVQAPGDIFAWVYHVRHLNALLAGLTAVVLYLLGRRLHGSRLGLLLVVLFTLDPFGVRINRRAMLETPAMLLTLAGMGLLLIDSRRGLLAGLLLGLALLTKEITFTAPLAVLLFGLWEHWRPGDRATKRQEGSPSFLLPITVAGLTYSLFPLWALTTGRWERFLQVKEVSLARLLGLAQLSGWNRPGVSLADFLLRRLTDYGSSYLLLGLGGVAVLELLFTQRHDRAGRLLAVWGLVLYPFYAFTALVGTGNDQFFYLLLVPAMLLVGYAAAVLPEGIGLFLARHHGTRRLAQGLGPWLRWGRNLAVGLFLAILLPYNTVRWWTAYGVGQDNGYRQLTTYVRKHLPPGEPLNASGDAIKFYYFFPDRPITDAATPEEARAKGVRYFVLAPKDVWAGYGRTTRELAAWLQAEGELLFAVDSDSYDSIFLYRMDYPREQPPILWEPRSFPPAETGFVAPFLLGLGVWLMILIGLTSATHLRSRRANTRPAACNLEPET